MIPESYKCYKTIKNANIKYKSPLNVLQGSATGSILKQVHTGYPVQKFKFIIDMDILNKKGTNHLSFI